LVDLQAKHWDPLHDWIQKKYGVKIQKTDSILFNSQTEETKQKLKTVLESLDQWELAG
jgi:ATP synthase F1 complex assembly factor 2